MKVSVISSFLLMLGLSSPIYAIERPPSLDEDTPKAKPANRAVQVAEPGAIPQVDQPAPAWLGVFGESADQTLTSQLGVDGGVVLRYVAKDSPAAEAGLKVHDLLTSINGKGITRQDELRATVQDCQPGDEVRLGVVSGGVKSEKTLKLTERPAKFRGIPRAPFGRNKDRDLPGDVLPDLKRQMEQMDQLFPNDPELQKQLEAQMEQMKKHLKELEKMPELKMEMELGEMLKNLPKQGKGIHLNMKSMGSVELLDEEGSVKMKMRDGGREVEVHNKAGELLYEGPWDNEQDKAAVEPEIRERIENLNMGANGKGFRLQIGPNNMGLDLDGLDADEEPDVADEKAAPKENAPTDEKNGDAELE
jgi:hypothetical protein